MKRHRVLAIEDDREIRDALIDILDEYDCDAVGVSNGQKALDYLKTAEILPCLILLDLMMPIMDGPQFRAEQLQDPRLAAIPVIVLSAYRDVRSYAENLSAAAFLKKPPKIDELVSAVERYC